MPTNPPDGHGSVAPGPWTWRDTPHGRLEVWYQGDQTHRIVKPDGSTEDVRGQQAAERRLDEIARELE